MSAIWEKNSIKDQFQKYLTFGWLSFNIHYFIFEKIQCSAKYLLTPVEILHRLHKVIHQLLNRYLNRPKILFPKNETIDDNCLNDHINASNDGQCYYRKQWKKYSKYEIKFFGSKQSSNIHLSCCFIYSTSIPSLNTTSYIASIYCVR